MIGLVDTGKTGACLEGKRKEFLEIHQERLYTRGKDSYVRESGIRRKSKLDTNSISVNIVEFDYYDSEEQECGTFSQ